MFYVGLGIAISCIIAIVWLSLRRDFELEQTRIADWQYLARLLDLDFSLKNSLPQIDGIYCGNYISLSCYADAHTTITMQVENVSGITMDIHDKWLADAFRNQVNLSTGDESLDTRYVITGQPRSKVLSIIQVDDFRNRLNDTSSLYIKLEGDTLTFENHAYMQVERQLDVDYWQQIIELLCMISRSI